MHQSEKNYSTIERELLAIAFATKYFQPYSYDGKFNIYTGYKPLYWLFSIKDANARLTNWRLTLDEHDYTIFYKKGSLNTNSDELSRIRPNLHIIEEENINEIHANDIFGYREEIKNTMSKPPPEDRESDENISKQNPDKESIIENIHETPNIDDVNHEVTNLNDNDDDA